MTSLGLPKEIKATLVRDAFISPCTHYRYWLSREWDHAKGALVFVMLNPSTADAFVDDPTIRKCMGFAYGRGFGGIIVVNLFAGRATQPDDMFNMADPVGPDNDLTLQSIFTEHKIVICGWGADVRAQARAQEVLKFAPPLMALAYNKDGSPKHPLYIPYDATISDWPRRPSFAA